MAYLDNADYTVKLGGSGVHRTDAFLVLVYSFVALSIAFYTRCRIDIYTRTDTNVSTWALRYNRTCLNNLLEVLSLLHRSLFCIKGRNWPNQCCTFGFLF